MPPTVPSPSDKITHALTPTCPRCAKKPTHVAERLERGVWRGTYAHDSHIWITEWAA